MIDETWQSYREREMRRIAAEIAAIEAQVNAYWQTRWLYRLIRCLSWRPWR